MKLIYKIPFIETDWSFLKIYLVAFQNLLSTLLACSFKLQKTIDFEKALCFPLSPVPLSLANPDGSPCKTTKSQLKPSLPTMILKNHPR